MRRVRLERVAIEIPSKQLLAGRDRFLLAHAVETKAAPRLFRTFDDESRAVGREAVGVRPDPPVLGLLKREGEGVEHLRRAEPHELVRPDVDVDPERVRISVTEARIDAVRGDNEVVAAPLGVRRVAFGLKRQQNAKFARAVLQYFEQALAADADEAVPARRDRLTAKVDVDVVPMRELGGDDRG